MDSIFTDAEILENITENVPSEFYEKLEIHQSQNSELIGFSVTDGDRLIFTYSNVYFDPKKNIRKIYVVGLPNFLRYVWKFDPQIKDWGNFSLICDLHFVNESKSLTTP